MSPCWTTVQGASPVVRVKTQVHGDSHCGHGPEGLALDSRRAAIYRAVFLAAGIYNILFGLWAILWPDAFFSALGLEAPPHLAFWSALGMVVGVYGLAYLYAARHMDRARPFIAIGLTGKLLGPAGWLLAVLADGLPAQTFILIAFNDLLWWLPFSLFLLEGTRLGAGVRALAPLACAVSNALAATALLLVLRQGTEAEPNAGARATYVASHLLEWRIGWFVWIAAGTSLVAFYAWWAARLPNWPLGLPGAAVGALGLVVDRLGLSLLVGSAPEGLEAAAPLVTLSSAVLGNGLYTAGGAILTFLTDSLSPLLRAWAWVLWTTGLVLSVASLLEWTLVVIAGSVLLFALLPPWCILVGKRLR